MPRILHYLANAILAVLTPYPGRSVAPDEGSKPLQAEGTGCPFFPIYQLGLGGSPGKPLLHSLTSISCSDIDIRQASFTDARIADLGQIQIGISPISVLSGAPQVTSLRLRGTDIYCPALHSPTGSQETILKNLSCTLQAKEGKWLLKRDLSFQLHNSTVSCAFPDGIPLDEPEQEPEQHQAPVLPKFYNFLAKLYSLQPHFCLVGFPNPPCVFPGRWHL